jgi:hypothetical protein
MANWTLADIRTKTRMTTGRPDASMMSNATLDDYINKFYQYVLTKELKVFWGYTYYQFFTEANVDQYVGPTTAFQTINPQAWCDGFPVEWYISPDVFYQDWPQQENKQTVATADGSTNSFSFNISAYPILPRSVYVTDGTQVVQDDGSGGFSQVSPSSSTGAVSGSVDYVTGTVTSLAFLSTPASNDTISATSETYQPNRPQGILYFKSAPLADATPASRDDQNYFVLRPVPDDVYLVKMQGIQIPPALTNSTDVPFRADLGPLIAYGASLEIFSDFNQMDQYEQTLVQYNRYKDVSMQDTYEEYLYQRSVPAF